MALSLRAHRPLASLLGGRGAAAPLGVGASRLLRSASAAKGHGQHPKARAVETPGRTPKNGKIRPAADKGFGPAERAWHVIDARGEVLGRLASKIVPLLCGKHKPTWQPQRDVGDFVVVTNVADVIVTGPKMEKKMYYRHTGFPGGLRVLSMEELIKKNPVEPLRKAVVGMLPKNKLRGQRLRRLRLFPGPEHVHEPQLRDATAGSYVSTLPVGDRPATFRRYEAPQRHD